MSLRNEGLEIQLNVTPIDNEFKWNSNLNFTFNAESEIWNQMKLFLPESIMKPWEWFDTNRTVFAIKAEIDEAVANGFISQLVSVSGISR